MRFALFLLAVPTAAVSVVAQDHAHHAGHGAAGAAATEQQTPAAGAFSLDTPVATLMADARAKAAVSAVLPGVDAHPSYEQFKGMSLNQLAPMAPTLLTPEALAKVKANLDAIK